MEVTTQVHQALPVVQEPLGLRDPLDPQELPELPVHPAIQVQEVAEVPEVVDTTLEDQVKINVLKIFTGFLIVYVYKVVKDAIVTKSTKHHTNSHNIIIRYIK